MKSGAYVRVNGKDYGARTKQARTAIRAAGWRSAPITRWNGFEWSDTGRVLHAAEAKQASVHHATVKKTKAELDADIAAVLARRGGKRSHSSLKKPGTAAVVTRVVNDQGRAFNVRLVRRGDHYGLTDGLVHDKADPLIEFWDAKYEHDPRFTPGLGQFVARYYLSTLAGRGTSGGLDLGNSPAWQVTGDNVAEAIAAAETEMETT